MKHTAQEVKSALFVISDFCTEQTSCKECPFGGIDTFDQSIPCLLKTSAPNEFFPFAMSIPAADFSKVCAEPNKKAGHKKRSIPAQKENE